MPVSLPASVDDTLALLARASYLADRALSTVLYLALKQGRPLFLEGEAGVGNLEGVLVSLRYEYDLLGKLM